MVSGLLAQRLVLTAIDCSGRGQYRAGQVPAARSLSHYQFTSFIPSKPLTDEAGGLEGK
jgi:hypothetical protein